ncbi:hypothetical protein ABPG72_012831 [Tetrahymena utriculariae]
MQLDKSMQNRQLLKEELSQYLKEKKQLSQFSYNLRAIQNKNSIQEFSRYISVPNSQLTTSLNLGQHSSKHSQGLSPKVEQSPYLKNNKSSTFQFFRNDSVINKQQKPQDIFKSTIKLKTDGADLGTPAYSPQKEPQNQDINQKQDQLKLPPINNKKKTKIGSNFSLNLKHLLIESPYTKQIKKYEVIFQKKVLQKRNHNFGNAADLPKLNDQEKKNEQQPKQISEQVQEQKEKTESDTQQFQQQESEGEQHQNKQQQDQTHKNSS